MPSRELTEGMDGRIPYDTQLGTDYRMDYIQKLGGIFALSSENDLPELMRFIDETVKKYGVFDLQLMILPPRGVQLLSDVVGQYSQTKQLWTVVMLLLLTLKPRRKDRQRPPCGRLPPPVLRGLSEPSVPSGSR